MSAVTMPSPIPRSPIAPSPIAPSPSTLSPITLSGRWVRLEPMTREQVQALALAAEPDRSSYGLTAVPDGVEGPGGARSYVETALAAAASGRELPFVVCLRSTGTVVGSTRFMDLESFGAASGHGRAPSDDSPPTVAEIGSTWYAASAQRTAVNSETKLLLLTQAFEGWGCLRVTFKTDARNHASRRAIERLGAQPEGVRRAHLVATDGTIRDSAYYSIVAAEWPAARDRLQQRMSSAARG